MKVYILYKTSWGGVPVVDSLYLIRGHAEKVKKELVKRPTGLKYKIQPWETAD